MRKHIKGYRFFKGTISLFILLHVFIIPAIAKASDSSYRDELLKKADTEKIYSDRYWGILLHYKPAGKGFASLVDDTRFSCQQQAREIRRQSLRQPLRDSLWKVKTSRNIPDAVFPPAITGLKKDLLLMNHGSRRFRAQSLKRL